MPGAFRGVFVPLLLILAFQDQVLLGVAMAAVVLMSVRGDAEARRACALLFTAGAGLLLMGAWWGDMPGGALVHLLGRYALGVVAAWPVGNVAGRWDALAKVEARSVR